jgi:hypothetical protein
MWRENRLSNWQNEILKDILQADSKLVIVADADGLLSEEKIQQELKEQHFEFMSYSDPVVFRYEYESRYRSKWDNGQQTDRRVLLRVVARDLNNIPFDIHQAGYTVNLNLGSVFPKLSYPILERLPVEYMDTLYQAYHDLKPASLGDNETCDFILRHIFQISVDLIKGPEELLKTLLRIHFINKGIPSVFIERLLQLIQPLLAFKQWPLKTLLSERDTFFKFLQERWPIFIDHISGKNTLFRERGTGYDVKVAGPQLLPFEQMDVRVYVDDLFLEGLLQPIKYEGAGNLTKTHKWAKVGLITGAHHEDMDTLGIFLESLKDAIPSEEARFQDWLSFAGKWAHLNELRFSISGLAETEIEKQISEYQKGMDIAFNKWIYQRYSSLYNMSATSPVMQHHVPRALVPCIGQGNRVALVVVDGMSFDQWLVIKNVIEQKNPKCKFTESALFAWAPTITSVSRQALFSGKIPTEFESSIMTTDKESSLWSQFWLQQGLSKEASAYINVVGDNDNLLLIKEICFSTKVKVLGLVVRKLDKIMHGMELGAAGMQIQVKHWAIEGFMNKLLDILRNHNFQINITSDHGNIEASGCGNPKEGDIADKKGERVRIYKDLTLRKDVAANFPGSLEWPSIGLPDTFLPLIASDRSAFIPADHSAVTHGGVCLEELIVPWLQVDWRES